MRERPRSFVKDFYKILGVARTATEDDIRKAYRRLARRYHPDVQPEDPLAGARFRELTEAYDVLGDPPRRRAYDAAFESGGAAAGHKLPGLDSFFASIFGTAPTAPRKGADLEVATDISLEEVAQGTTVTLALTPPSGEVRRLRVKIPAGVEDGTTVRLPREGDPGDFGGLPGDLLVRVRVKPHTVFRREGADLWVELPVSVFTAVLGGRVSCPGLDGPLELDIPAGTQGNAVFRFPGGGLPQSKGRARGNLNVRVHLLVPAELDDAQREAWERLAAASLVPAQPR